MLSEGKYNGIANLLMLIGIASALLFDSGIASNAVAGGIGIVAAIGAVFLYFWNQRMV